MATRMRTATGSATTTIGSYAPLQVVSLAGTSGFSANSNVHGFSTSSGGRTAARTRMRTAVAAGAPSPGPPGGSRTITVQDDYPSKWRPRTTNKPRVQSDERPARGPVTIRNGVIVSKETGQPKKPLSQSIKGFFRRLGRKLKRKKN